MACGARTDAEFSGVDGEGPLHFAQRVGFVGSGKGGSDAVRGGSAGAPDAMHEVFGFFGHVVIDDVGYVGHIDAARGDVGGNEDAMVPLSEAAQSSVALGLRAVPMNWVRRSGRRA